MRTKSKYQLFWTQIQGVHNKRLANALQRRGFAKALGREGEFNAPLPAGKVADRLAGLRIAKGIRLIQFTDAQWCYVGTNRRMGSEPVKITARQMESAITI